MSPYSNTSFIVYHQTLITMDLIDLTYGQNADLYKDVLRVSPVASDQDVQAAFVDRRYELFSQLQNASNSRAPTSEQSPNGKAVTDMTERQFTEKKMDALIASYRLLSDAEKRRQYNMSLSLAAAKEKKNSDYTTTSPKGVPELKKSLSSSPAAGKSIAWNGSPTNTSRISSSEPFDEFDEFDDSRELATSYSNPHKGPTPSKHSGPSPSHTKKKLFHSPDGSMGGKEQGILKNGTSPPGRNARGHRRAGSTHSDTDGSSYIEGSSHEGEFTDGDLTYETDGSDDFEHPMSRRESELKNMIRQKTKSSNALNRASPDRKVRWSKSAESHASQQEKRTKKKPKRLSADSDDYDENDATYLSSWLRANDFTDQADFVEDVGKEIAGVASDTFLAFGQIFSAFTIDEDAIDSVASNIVGATEDLEDLKR
jgi:hypothetical protein